MSKLTTAKIRKLNDFGRSGDGGGLYLNVSKSGTKSWVQRVRIDGRRTDKGLGGFPSVGLSEARRIADANRVALAKGRNPWATGVLRTETNAPVDVPSFEVLARRCHTVNVAAGRWTNAKNISNWIHRAEKHVFPKIGNRPVDVIKTAEIRDDILIPLASSHPETAKRVRIIVKDTFDFAVESELIDTNPVSRIPSKRLRRPVPKHLDSIDYTLIPDALERLRDSDAWEATKLCLTFQILTAARPGEARNARWDEIDLTDNVRVIDAERMKARRDHRIPLSVQATVLLRTARRKLDSTTGLVFPAPNGKPLSENALNMRTRKLGIGTAHGLRAAFMGWCAEASVPLEVAQLSLAHQIGNTTTQAYFRTDLLERRREVMQSWADHVDGPLPF